jgi:hypothetical protein
VLRSCQKEAASIEPENRTVKRTVDVAADEDNAVGLPHVLAVKPPDDLNHSLLLSRQVRPALPTIVLNAKL